MTRDTNGKKYFNDSHIDNLSSYLNVVTKTQYQILDSRSQINNVFHTSLMRKEITLKNHLLENLTPNSTKENIIDLAMPNSDIKNKIEHQIRQELLQLFNKVST
jgi:S-adenosylmethionine decarboxylase